MQQDKLKPMSLAEYMQEYARLEDVFPHIFKSEAKKGTVFRFVDSFEIEWFSKLVDRIVISGRGDKIDIGDAVAAERRARSSAKFADDLCGAMTTWNGISDSGLDNVLRKYKASNLLEAISSSRKGVV